MSEKREKRRRYNQRLEYIADFNKAIKEMPKGIIVDVAPVRHGQWEIGDYYDIGDVCSECLWDSQMVQPSYQYCPNCGAKMDEVY